MREPGKDKETNKRESTMNIHNNITPSITRTSRRKREQSRKL